MGFVYIAAAEVESPPQVMDLNIGGRQYKFRLETCHLGEARRAPKWRDQEHSHPVYHVVLFQEGENAFQLGGLEVECGPGTLVLTSPGEPRSFSALHPEPMSYHEITFSLENSDGEPLTAGIADLLSLYTGMDMTDNNPSVFRFTPRQREWCNLFYERIRDRLSEPSGPNWFFIHRIVLDLIAYLVEEIYLPSSGVGAGDPIDRARL